MRIAKQFAGFALVILTLAIPSLAATDKITWKPLPDAILRVDDHPPKEWNVFSANKKDDPLLLQIGTRSLVIYVQQQKVYELAPTALEHKGSDLLWLETNKPAQPLATSEWIIRDVGAAMRIRMKLNAEAHVVDLQLPEVLNNHVFF